MSMKRNFYVWPAAALLISGLASCSNDEVPVADETEYGKLAFTINFTQSGNTRAEGDGGDSSTELPGTTTNGSQTTTAVSDAVPLTSWSNVKSLQIFLYDAQGVIHFSDLIDTDRIQNSLTTNPNESGSVTYTYANVPSGTYRLMAVANANSAIQPIKTQLAGNYQAWTAYNVLNRFIYNCKISPADHQFPIFYQNQVAASGQTRSEVPLAEPTEIFLGQGFVNGTDPAVTVVAGQTTAAAIKLKREVSLMRLRMNIAGEEGKTNNADVNMNPDGKVNFLKDASVMIATVPDYVIPMAQDRMVNGEKIYAGTSGTSSSSSVIVTDAVEGPRQFYTSNPTSGYKAGGKIIGIEGDEYKANAWRDIIVLPNNNRQQLSGTSANEPLKQNRYLLIISAKGLPGHVCKEGTLTEEKTVYWVGYINQGFVANTIREVNVIFRDGGTMELPERPDNVGNLTVTVGQPQDWDSAITASKIEL